MAAGKVSRLYFFFEINPLALILRSAPKARRLEGRGRSLDLRVLRIPRESVWIFAASRGPRISRRLRRHQFQTCPALTVTKPPQCEGVEAFSNAEPFLNLTPASRSPRRSSAREPPSWRESSAAIVSNSARRDKRRPGPPSRRGPSRTCPRDRPRRASGGSIRA